MATGALIIQGRGGNLGSLSPFARTLRVKLKATYGSRVITKSIERRDAFFNFLSNPGTAFTIAEIHVFSHAFGAGLALGYADPALTQSRKQLYLASVKRKRPLTYAEVLNQEKGIVFTEDLIQGLGASRRCKIRSHLASGATMKIWGCNARRGGWTYTDAPPGVRYHYWEALNTRNSPKPSICAGFADYLGINVSAAASGANIFVKDGAKWVSSRRYRQTHGHYPSGALPHQFRPERGSYDTCNPTNPGPACVSVGRRP